MIDKEQLKKSLTLTDIEKILLHLGSDAPQRDRNDNLVFQTICHNTKGKGQHKLYYYNNSCLFHCYTNCGTFDIYELVQKVKELEGEVFSFNQAIDYVKDLVNYRVSNQMFSFDIKNRISDWDFINMYKKIDFQKIELPIYPSCVLDVFQKKYHIKWLKENISKETMEKYKIMYYLKDNKIVIPHYDIDGRLIGIRGRALLQEDIDKGRKYMPIKIENTIYSHPTSFNLYGINNTLAAIKRMGKVLIFEGEKSVLKSDTFYGENNFTVSCSGSNISSYQKQMILNLGVKEVFIAFDKYILQTGSEKEEQEYKSKILKIAKEFSPYVRTYILYDDKNLLDYGDAPCDKGKEVFEQLLRNKKEINTVG